MHIDEQILFEYLDSELTSEMQQQVEGHLEECLICAAQLSSIQAFYQDIENVPDIPLSRNLAPTVLAQIKQDTRWNPVIGWAAAFQFGIALLIIALTAPTIWQVAVARGFAEKISLTPIDWATQLEVIQLQLAQFLEPITSFQTTLDLPFTYLATIPVIIASGVLWLVGNSILLRRTWQKSQIA